MREMTVSGWSQENRPCWTASSLRAGRHQSDEAAVCSHRPRSRRLEGSWCRSPGLAVDAAMDAGLCTATVPAAPEVIPNAVVVSGHMDTTKPPGRGCGPGHPATLARHRLRAPEHPSGFPELNLQRARHTLVTSDGTTLLEPTTRTDRRDPDMIDWLRATRPAHGACACFTTTRSRRALSTSTWSVRAKYLHVDGAELGNRRRIVLRGHGRRHDNRPRRASGYAKG